MQLNLNGPVTDHTSYGLVLLNLFNNLTLNKEDIFVHPISGVSISNKEFAAITNRINRLFPYDAPCLRVYHQFSMAESIGRGPRCGMVFSETDELTEFETYNLNSLDLVIVPSEWAKSIYVKSGVQTRIEVAELGYDPAIFYPIKTDKEKCIFLSVGKWEVRKQQTQIVDAFNSAFTNSDNVELWLCDSNPFMRPEELDAIHQSYKNSKLGSLIKILPRQKSQKDIARLMNTAFCFVAPSLAEGANLELIESMACGMHTIATNYSGHTAFICEKTTRLIEPRSQILAVDNKWFNSGKLANCGRWCTYDLSDLVNHMKDVYDLFKTDKTASLNTAAIEHAKSFTWKNTADKTLSFIESV